MLILLGAVGCVLLIVCVNVSNLLLVRNVARQQKIAMRVVLGAGRFRVLRQLLTETLILVSCGSVLGVVLASWGMHGLLALAPDDVPRLSQVRVNVIVLGFAIAAALLTISLVGLIPAYLTGGFSLSESLKSRGRTATASSASRSVLNALVIAEFALALVLLIGAGLLVRSFAVLRGVDPGFHSENLLTMTLSLPEGKYEWNHNTVFCNEVIRRVATLPDVKDAGAIRGVPMAETNFWIPLVVHGRTVSRWLDLPLAHIRVVTPSYFRVMGIPLLSGRLFEPHDLVGKVGEPPAAIINRTMADQFWPNEDPLGQRVTWSEDDDINNLEDNRPWIKIVGVVGNIKYGALNKVETPDIYYPEALFPQSKITLIVRTEIEPLHLMSTIQDEVRDYEPSALISDTRTMQQVISRSVAERRFYAIVLSSFSAAALILSLIGTYGVISYTVSQRIHEIGIRMALGAQRGEVLQLIMMRCLKLLLIGTVIGLAAAVAFSRILSSQLYGVSSLDPLTLVGASILMNIVGLAACLLPALRATTVDPIIALRYE